jgi:hypothetical protein
LLASVSANERPSDDPGDELTRSSSQRLHHRGKSATPSQATSPSAERRRQDLPPTTRDRQAVCADRAARVGLAGLA